MRQGVLKLVLTSLLLTIPFVGSGVQAKQWGSQTEEISVSLNSLPKQGQETYQLIRLGGPFSFEKDGVVFGNRERLLPAHKRGYYREYTVKTPQSRDRGARRIVCGGFIPSAPDACYYTDDHYASFRRIVQSVQ